MKQSPSAVDKLQQVFNLSDGEKNFLLNCDRGQGLFFAGANHVGIQVLSSQSEHELITSDPREIEARKSQKGMTDTRSIQELAQIYDPPAAQQPMKNISADSTKQSELIERAVERRQEDIQKIQSERNKYQEELEKRLREQEEILNPKKFESQKSFVDMVEENTIPGQVRKQREELNKGRTHITPQGIIENDDKSKQ